MDAEIRKRRRKLAYDGELTLLAEIRLRLREGTLTHEDVQLGAHCGVRACREYQGIARDAVILSYASWFDGLVKLELDSHRRLVEMCFITFDLLPVAYGHDTVHRMVRNTVKAWLDGRKMGLVPKARQGGMQVYSRMIEALADSGKALDCLKMTWEGRPPELFKEFLLRVVVIMFDKAAHTDAHIEDPAEGNPELPPDYPQYQGNWDLL